MSGIQLERDIGSAGAISLVIQAAFPCLVAPTFQSPHVFRTPAIPIEPVESEITFLGGTNVAFSPPVDHTQLILLPILATMGITGSIDITKRGYYPVGGGEVSLKAKQAGKITPLQLTTRGRIVSAHGTMYGIGTHFTAELQADFARSMNTALRSFCDSRGWSEASSYLADHKLFKGTTSPAAKPPSDRCKEQGKGGKKRVLPSTFGAQVCLVCEDGLPISANVLFTGKEENFVEVDLAVRQIIAQLALVTDTSACVDEHTADQLMIYMALCAAQNPGEAGRSQILVAPKITEEIFEYPPVPAGVASADRKVPGTAPVLSLSSLHIEAAMHIPQLFLNCAFTMEEVGPHKCRLITCTGTGTV
jgi:RNA 3'-terminal phosphate cyclase